MPNSSTGLKGKVVLLGIAIVIVPVLYSIATESRPLVNHDATYRFKFDSGNVVSKRQIQ